MSSEQKFRTMLEMQIAINDHTVPGWREKNLAWRDAIWIECAELMDHIGWKWWKKQEPNLEQARMELVDIWHFGMSLGLSDGYPVEDLVRYYVSREKYIEGEKDRQVGMESKFIRRITSAASGADGFDVISFFVLCGLLGMSLDDLYSRYVCKNVLNKFRQDNGYKEGRYLKQWFGEEDNVWLENIVADLDMNHPDFKDLLYEQMRIDYEEAKREIWVG